MNIVWFSILGCQDTEQKVPQTKEIVVSKTQTQTQTKKAKKIAPIDPPTPAQEPLVGGPYPGILLTQAWFWTDEKGDSHPGPARLEIWRKGPEKWLRTRIEDGDSNVFHKAIPYEDGILTIGAEKALLKKWTHKEGRWSATTLWEKSWGGKFNRLRDIEVGDVDGDGKDELVIATHDYGVIAVFDNEKQITELDPKPDTFIHEIEIGDVDGDGKKEFFATPSDRNSTKHSQGGSVVMYKYDGKSYVRETVVAMDKTHAKEILVDDVDGDGKDELYVVNEAVKIGEAIITPVQIVRYTENNGVWERKVIHSIQDSQTRFLVAGDWNGDGKKDLVAAAMKSGLWFLERSVNDEWSSLLIDPNSSGFEHSAYGADLDKNGVLELYVASDDQGALHSYTYKEGAFQKNNIGEIAAGTFTWNIVSGEF